MNLLNFLELKHALLAPFELFETRTHYKAYLIQVYIQLEKAPVMLVESHPQLVTVSE
jgi:hypothetical protein